MHDRDAAACRRIMPRVSARLRCLSALLCAGLLTLMHTAQATELCLDDGEVCDAGDDCCGTCIKGECPPNADPKTCRGLCVGAVEAKGSMVRNDACVRGERCVLCRPRNHLRAHVLAVREWQWHGVRHQNILINAAPTSSLRHSAQGLC